MFHLVVTHATPKRKIGSIVTDPVEIKAILAGAEARTVVKVFDHLTHASASPRPNAPAVEAKTTAPIA